MQRQQALRLLPAQEQQAHLARLPKHPKWQLQVTRLLKPAAEPLLTLLQLQQPQQQMQTRLAAMQSLSALPA
jgi:hypothetical protein